MKVPEKLLSTPVILITTNPTKGLAGAKFHIESESGSFSKDVTTGSDGTATLENLTPGTYAVTETAPRPKWCLRPGPWPHP